MLRMLIALFSWFAISSAFGSDITGALSVGHEGEYAFRVGPRFDLSEHWAIDTGVSLVEYHHGEVVQAADVTPVHRWKIGSGYFEVGTAGVAIWSAKDWHIQRSATLWTFSNQVGGGWSLSSQTKIGVVYRHYSNLCFSPNSSKDFIGLGIQSKTD